MNSRGIPGGRERESFHKPAIDSRFGENDGALEFVFGETLIHVMNTIARRPDELVAFEEEVIPLV